MAKPFALMNVNTDLAAGEVMNWNGGALQGVMRDCGFSVTLKSRRSRRFYRQGERRYVDLERSRRSRRSVRSGENGSGVRARALERGKRR